MPYVDQDITCKDCKSTFVFTEGEQEFFATKQFTPPVRCKPCRDIRKQQKNQNGGGGGRRDDAPRTAFQPPPEPIVETRNRKGRGRRKFRDDSAGWDD